MLCCIPIAAATEDDLEAELLALTGGKGTKKGSKKPKGDKGNMSMADIDKMLASVKDIGEGGDDDDDDDGADEGSMSDIDEDDLLAELQVRLKLLSVIFFCSMKPMLTSNY